MSGIAVFLGFDGRDKVVWSMGPELGANAETNRLTTECLNSLT